MATFDPYADSIAVAGVLKPYSREPKQGRWRRRRFAIFAGVAAFCILYGMVFAFVAPDLLVPLAAPLALLATLIVWALPNLRAAPSRTLEFFLFALIVSQAMWPNYLAIALPGMPWITLIRLTGFPMTFLLLVCVSVSPEFRSQMAKSLSGAPLIWKIVCAFVFIEFYSIALSADKGFSIDKFIVAQISWTAVFFASAYVFRTPGRIERWAKLMWSMAFAIGLIVIMEARVKHVLWGGHVPSLLKVNDPRLTLVMAGMTMRAYTNVYRAMGTFSTPLALSEFFALTFPFVLHFMQQGTSWWIRTLAAITVPYMFYIVYLSGARSGMLGMLIGGMLYLSLWAALRWRTRKDDLVAPAIILTYPAVGALVLGATLFVGKIHKLVLGGGAAAASTYARVVQYHMGIPLIIRNPLGYGIGEGANTLGYFDPSGILTIDTYYLAVALEYGVIGFFVYYGLFISGAIIGLKNIYITRNPDKEQDFLVPVVISFLVFIVIKSIFSNQDNHSILFIMLGILTALCSRRGESKVCPAQVDTNLNRCLRRPNNESTMRQFSR